MSTKSIRVAALACALAMVVSSASAQGNRGKGYVQKNLVSDLPGMAARTDPNLVNSWGVALGPTTSIWVANEATGTSTIYLGNGRPSPLVVTVPSASDGQGTPTGVVFHNPA